MMFDDIFLTEHITVDTRRLLQDGRVRGNHNDALHTMFHGMAECERKAAQRLAPASRDRKREGAPRRRSGGHAELIHLLTHATQRRLFLGLRNRTGCLHPRFAGCR